MIEAKSWRLIEDECTGCGICADVCSYDAIEMNRDAAYPRSIPDACTACGECAQECPFDAIRVDENERIPEGARSGHRRAT